MPGLDRRHGRLFEEVAELYDRVRPSYPDELFNDLAAMAGIGEGSSVLEVGCGTGQATAPLALLGCSVTAVEPGPAMATLARAKLAGLANVEVETSSFEEWDDRGRHFDGIVAASSWHWVDPTIGWARVHRLLRDGGSVSLLANVVVRRPGEVELYAATADLHERFSPANPSFGHPPLEEELRATKEGWGTIERIEDPGPLFERPTARFYPNLQWLDGNGVADLLGSISIYRSLDPEVRSGLLDAIVERVRTAMGDRVPRRYLSVLRVGRRAM